MIELLVVMAITVILLGLIFGPMVQGFNLVNRARVQVLAQDTARQVMGQIERELADGVFIHDNSGLALNFWVPTENGQGEVAVPVAYARLDVTPPAHVNDQNPTLGAGVEMDPTTGLPVEDARGPLALPIAPGRVIYRYWIGLRDNATRSASGASGMPIKPYVNYYENTQDDRYSVRDHNPFVLYRAVFSPYLMNGQVDGRLINIGRYGSVAAALADPNFFYDNDQAAEAMPGWKDLNKDGKVNFSENWAAVARPMVPIDRADMAVARRKDNKMPVYVNGLMRIDPLVRFQPTFVGNDGGVPSSVSAPHDEAPNVAAGTSVETYGHWTEPYRVHVVRSALDAPTLRYFHWNGSGPVLYNGTSTGFDPHTIDAKALPSSAYPWSRPRLLLNSLNTANPLLLFTVDPVRGQVNFAFPESIYWHDSQGQAVSSESAMADLEYSPAAVNANYASTSSGGNHYRWLSLLDLPNGTPSPLLEWWTLGVNGEQVPGMRIVPGSEVVRGPDMRPGPSYGHEVAYTRVSRLTDPMRIGANEYMINYDNIPSTSTADTSDPTTRRGTLIFCSLPAAPGSVSALPESYVDGSGSVVPAAPLTVTYQVQGNLSTDVVKADYLTRQLMTVALSVRLFDLNSGAPQTVTLTQKVRVRNLQR